MKTLCIAYCGGCNAAYDRVAFVNGLLEDVRAAGGVIRLVDTDEASDMALIVAGCQAVCVADREDLGSRAMVRRVVGPNMLDGVAGSMAAVHAALKAELLA